MTPAAVVLLAGAAVAAIVDWAAVGRGLRRVEFVAKPAATLAILGAAAALVVGARLVRALRRDAHGAPVAPVVAYVVVIGAMVTVAVASGNALAAAGAVAFLASDAMIGEQRFVRPRRLYPVAIMVTYHAALVLLVLSLRI